jgi:hypothetical protein
MFQASTFGINLSTAPFSLKDIENFPYSDYTELQEVYDELWSWYSGLALNETQTQGDKEVELYPLHLNPIKSALAKHVQTLFGEIPDNAYGSLVQPRVLVRNNVPVPDDAEKVEQFLQDIWEENSGASIQYENAIISQIYGGCIFKVSWIAEERRIGIEKINPSEFMCIPYMNNPWKLKQAWVIRPIDEFTAKQFGVELNQMTGWYIESWEEDKYSITINNSPIMQQVGDEMYKIGGLNPFGFVPFVYIPHERTTTFWGSSVITQAVIGIVKEKNLRIADAGDATSDESHSLLVMRNVRGSPQIKRIGRHIPVIDLGSNQSLNNIGDPELTSVKRASLSETMIALTQDLHKEFRREVYVPAVADGEDEGSQRSGVTLANRMWPLVSHARGERVHWTSGISIIHGMILTIAVIKKIGNITAEDLKMKMRCKWYSSLPRDREQLSSEIVARSAQSLGSHEHLVGLYGDVDDMNGDMEKTKEWLEFQAELKQPAIPEGEASNGSKSDSGGSKKAQRSGGRKVSDSD